jgi:PAS domain S-box-containing protein
MKFKKNVVSFGNIRIAIAFLIVGFGITIAASYNAGQNEERLAETEYVAVCNEITMKIDTRLRAHATFLRAGSAFFEASDTITRKKWDDFVKQSKIERNLPGIQGVGFSLVIPQNQLQEHVQAIRNEGFPGYDVKPKGDRGTYTSIVFLEPFSGRNLRAFGYDMFSEPIRRKAMELSCDSDVAMLSGKVFLVQETNKDVQPGTLMYVPVYRDGLPADNTQQRRAALKGWVYSPYRMTDLMEGILGRWDLLQEGRIHLQVYDDSISVSSLLYDSQPNLAMNSRDLPSRSLTLPVMFNGKKWVLCFSQSKIQLLFSVNKAVMVLIGGIVINLLLFGLFLSLINTKTRALQIAHKLTTKLNESETRFSLFMDHLPAIAFIKDNSGKTLFVNQFMDNIIGASKWIGKDMHEVFPNEFGEKLLADDLRVLKQGFEKVEESIIQLDGKLHHFETQKFVIPRHAKEPILGGVSIDITERKQTEQKLLETYKKLDAIVSASPDGIGILSIEGKILFISEKLALMYGFSTEEKEENIGRNIFGFIDPSNHKKLTDNIHNLLSGKDDQKMNEYLAIKKDGHKFYVEVNSTVLKDLDGNPESILFIERDITDRKSSEELLLQTRQNYESFFNTIDDFLFVLDEHGNMVHVNTTVINRLGYTWDELSGKPVLMVHPTERQAEAGRIVGEMLQGIAAFCPVPVMTKQGTQIPVETRVLQGTWDGKPAIFGVTKDISRIQLSEEKFSKLFHLNPSACGLSDIDTRKYIEVNEAFYNLFGFDKDEVIGNTAFDLGIFTPEASTTLLRSADPTGKVTNIETSLKAKNGDIKHVLVSAENIYVQDKKYRFTVVLDITERKKAEEELKKSEAELQQLNATKDKFFSIIAHDLKSPFNAIVGFSDLLVERVKEKDYNGIDVFASNILKSSNRAMDLLTNLMEWSRSQTGRMVFNPINFDLVGFLADIVPMFDDIAGQKSITIRRDLPPKMSVSADQAMISTVFRNLISNAIKFTKPGGTITLSVIQNANEIMVSVRDTGIGIPDTMIGKLFQIDQCYSTPGTNREQGTGLGLILCKEFVEKHGGKIWAESEEGKGSVFFFTLKTNN